MATPVTLRGVEILPGSWRNFSGRATDFNDEGNRNFNIRLEADNPAVDQLETEGWNLKRLKPRDEFDDEPAYYLPVKLGYNENGGPKCEMVIDRRVTPLTERSIGELDHMRIISAKLVLRPYNWTFKGREGITAWLATGRFYCQVEDPFADDPDDSDLIYGDDNSATPF